VKVSHQNAIKALELRVLNLSKTTRQGVVLQHGETLPDDIDVGSALVIRLANMEAYNSEARYSR